jgi:hypothetical protein
VKEPYYVYSTNALDAIIISCEVPNTGDTGGDDDAICKLVICSAVISLLFSPRIAGENDLSLCSLGLFRGYAGFSLECIDAWLKFVTFKVAAQRASA